MEQEIKKIIEQHLPEQTASVMKEFIEKAEATERQLTVANNMLKEQKETIEKYQEKEDQLAEAGDKLEAARSLMEANEKRKIGLDDEARNMRCSIIETEMKMMKFNINNMTSLVEKVFGHPSVSITRNIPVPVEMTSQGQYGSQGGEYVEKHDEVTTETHSKA